MADEQEFYYARARCAEALGYVKRDHPEVVRDPEILADFRIGLSFDEPGVKEKLAKALEYAALGDPSRFRRQVASPAEHLDDEQVLVRYHLCTALTAVGCDHPSKPADLREALVDRFGDENSYVRGRATEVPRLGARVDGETVLTPDRIETGENDAADFVAPRVAFLRTDRDGTPEEVTLAEVGTLGSLRDEMRRSSSR